LGPSKLPSRFNLNASYNLPVNQKTLFQLSALYTRQNTFDVYQFAVNAIFSKNIMVGMGYMTSETPFINVGYRSNMFSFMLGYDISYSKLYGNTAGSLQLSLALSFLKKEINRSAFRF
jgi:hypothetical protein